MINRIAKVAFELTKEGRVTIEVRGNKSAVKAGLLSIVVYIDEMIATATFSKEMAKDPGIILSDILNNLFGGDDEEPEGCDGDCDRHEEMPQEMKEFFYKMVGGLN